MVSAIKVQGKRLYTLAREGKTVDRQPRRIIIRALDIIRVYKEKVDGIELVRDFTKIDFRVICSKGTYVRVLAEDIGKALSCGGHLSRLIRIKSGNFEIKDSIELEKIQNDPESASHSIKSIDEVLSFMPGIVVNEIGRTRFLNGVPLSRSEIIDCDSDFQMGKLLKVHDESGMLLGLCEAVVKEPKASDFQDIVCKAIKVLK